MTSSPEPGKCSTREAARFAVLIEHVADIVYFLDAEGRIDTWTPAAERTMGYAAAEVLGQRPEIFYTAEARAAGAPAAHLEEARRLGRHVDEALRVRKDGSTFWAHVTSCAVRDAQGALDGYAKIVHDLTLRHDAAEAQRLYTRALEMSNQDLSRYAAAASHDLQEPLRKIHAFADRLQRKSADRLDEEGREQIEKIRAVASRMQRLIDDMLTYARVTGEQVRRERVSLNEVVADVASELRQQLVACGGTLAVSELPTIQGDRGQFRQLFHNLFANALKFRKRDVAPVIEVTANALAAAPHPVKPLPVPRWELRVRDNGIGFEQKYAEKIFEMSQRLHPRDKYEGSGIGLTICHRIVQRHDGTIRALSGPGEGSTFVINLPETQPERS